MSSSEATSSDAEEQPGENVEYSEAKGDGTMYVIFGVLALVVIVVIVLLVIFFTRGDHESPAMLNGTATSRGPMTVSTVSGMPVSSDIPGNVSSGMTHPGTSGRASAQTRTARARTTAKATTVATPNVTEASVTTAETTTIAPTAANGSQASSTVAHPPGGRAGGEEDVPTVEIKGTVLPSTRRKQKIFVVSDTSGPEAITVDPNYIPNREKPGNPGHDGGGPQGSVLKRSPTNGSDAFQPLAGISALGVASANDTTGAKLSEQDVHFNGSFGNASDTGVGEQPADGSASVADDGDGRRRERDGGVTLRSNRSIRASPQLPTPSNSTPRSLAAVDYQHGPFPSQLIPVPLDDIV